MYSRRFIEYDHVNRAMRTIRESDGTRDPFSYLLIKIRQPEGTGNTNASLRAKREKQAETNSRRITDRMCAIAGECDSVNSSHSTGMSSVIGT